MSLNLLAATLGAGAALIAEQWVPSDAAGPLGLSLFVIAVAVCPASKRWPPLLSAAVVLATLLPISFMSTFNQAGETSAVVTLYSLAFWVLGIGGCSWLLASQVKRGPLITVMLLGSLTVAGHIMQPASALSPGQSLLELEWDLARGKQGRLPEWVVNAMNANVGPERLRHFCKLAGELSDQNTQPQTQQAFHVCDAVMETFPEHGARKLIATNSPLLARLAVDLFAQAGLWDEAARATHQAVKLGAPYAALNFWRWKAVKGRANRVASSWAGWNAETKFDGPAGSERSAVRVTRTPGSMKPMVLPNGQRAVMAVNRYADAFTLSLPLPPRNERVEKIKLQGKGRSGFALEILDASRTWHRFKCRAETKVSDLSSSPFCQTSFGDVVIEIDESIQQPIRQIRLRGNFIISQIEAITPR